MQTVVPVHAGVFRTTTPPRSRCASCPRARGGIPQDGVSSRGLLALSPCTRGYSALRKGKTATRRVAPLTYSKRINFQCTITLPAKQPKSRKPKPKAKAKAKKPTKGKKPRRTPSPVELQERQQKRREYEKTRSQRPERKQDALQRQSNKRQRAKELGICSACSQPAIAGQTRCPTCAEKHRTWNRQNSEQRRSSEGANPHQPTLGNSENTLQKSLPIDGIAEGESPVPQKNGPAAIRPHPRTRGRVNKTLQRSLPLNPQPEPPVSP